MSHRFRPAVVLAAALALPLGAGAAAEAPRAGVYQYVVTRAQGTRDAVAAAIAEAAPAAGFRVLARVPAGAPAGCGYAAEVLALYHPEYGREVLAANRRTGPFAVVDRVNVFEDERGVHVSVLNPRSILRTVLMDDARQASLAEAHLAALRGLVSGAVTGTSASRDYGEVREKGYIGKTMGVMAGGPFAEKVEAVAVLGGADWQAAVDGLRAAMEKKGPRWGLHLAYALEIPEAETAVLGATGTPMDTRSFEIVRAGADSSRDGLRCPGLAHAGAYPIEVVVVKETGVVRVRRVDSMYRMKMYFEDAGKWAFMKNMGMPGSIGDELSAQIRSLTPQAN